MSSEKAEKARELLRRRHFGVLATQSTHLPGYPFGSVVPYVLDGVGRPLILISTLALHTKNIQKDARVSLTVWDDEEGPDQQAAGRVTWVGDAAPVPPDELEAGKARYLRYLPSSEGHFAMHDFVLHRIDLKRLRYIGGFGAIYWVDADEMLVENPFMAAEDGILSHVNEDHATGLVECLKLQTGKDATRVVMVGVDPAGFDVLADDRRMRIRFENPAAVPDDVRREMIRVFHTKVPQL